MAAIDSRPENKVRVQNTVRDIPNVSAGVLDALDPQGREGIVLRGIEAGAGITINVVDADNNVFKTPQRKIVISAAGSGASGEANTASNLGSGEGVFASKQGIDLRFRSLVAGPGVTLNGSPNTITISATGEANAGINLGAGGVGKAELYAGKSGTDLQFKRIIAGSNISVTQTSSDITISAASTGETNDGANMGSGTGLYMGKSGATLQFRTLVAGSSGNFTVTQSGNQVILDVNNVGEINVGSNLGTAGANRAEVYAAKSGTALQFKRLVGGSNISLTQDGNEITIAATGVGETNDGINLGTSSASNASIYAGKQGVNLQFRRIQAGTNVSLTQTTDSIVINTVGEANAGEMLGTFGADIYAGKAGSNLQFRKIVGTGLVQVTQNANDITITTSAEKNAGENLGTTGARVFAQMQGSNLQFRRLKAGPNVNIVEDPDFLTISAPAVGETNDGLNLGTSGIPVFAGKTGLNLQFRRIEAGAGVSVAQSPDGSSVVITNTQTPGQIYTAANLGSTPSKADVFSGMNGNEFQYRSIVAGNGISLSVANGEITITNSSLESTTYSSYGTASDGEQVIGTKSGADLRFKRLKAGNNVTITDNGNYLQIDSTATAAASTTAGNINGSGVGVYVDKVGDTLRFRGVNKGSDKVTVTQNNSLNTIDIDIDESKINVSNTAGNLPVGRVTGLSQIATSGVITDATGSLPWNRISGAPTIPTTLSSLSDVSYSGTPGNGSILKFNASTNKWELGSDLAGTGTVTSVAVQSMNSAISVSGSPITSNGTIQVTFNASAVNLDDINGTLTVSKLVAGTAGQVLSTNGSGQVVWSTPGTAPVQSVAGKTGAVTLVLDDLTDVVITSAEAGQVLRHNGTSFVNAALSASDIAGLSAVATSGLISDTTGTLGVARGGTGTTTFTKNGLLVGDDANSLKTIAVPAVADTYLKWDGSAFVWGAATGLQTVSGDTAPALGGNLDVAGFTITSASNGDVVIDPNGNGKTIIGGIMHEKRKTAVINDNQIANSVFYSYNAASYEAVFVDYVIRRAGAVRIGTLMVTHDGSSTVLSDHGTENSNTGVNIDAVMSSGSVDLYYNSTSTGNNGTITFSVRGWDL